MDGDHYCKTLEELRNIFEHLDPRPAFQKYCLVKLVDEFTKDELPECVTFFVRPESMCGLHEICMYITSEAEVVVDPNLTACASISAWPFHYLQKGQRKAIIGGFDSVARKYFKVDELSFTAGGPGLERGAQLNFQYNGKGGHIHHPKAGCQATGAWHK